MAESALPLPLPLPLPKIPDLAAELFGLLEKIPPGRVTTYGRLAAALGDPVAARWVGQTLIRHPHDEHCLCHRVVRVDGTLGTEGQETEEKQRRLEAEGVEVIGGRVAWDRFGFDFELSQKKRPLETLRLFQEQVQERAQMETPSPQKKPRLVGGVDVSYVGPELGIAGYCLVELETAKVVWSTTVAHPVRFPYITGYLSFRELPLLLALMEKVRAAGWEDDVLLVDGSGMLHPRGAGIATHLGVVLDCPTIGATKKLLCGQVDLKEMAPREVRPVVWNGAAIGAAIRPTSGSRRPIFVSPGHRTDPGFAVELALKLLKGHRLPEPIYWADRMSREKKNKERDCEAIPFQKVFKGRV